MLNKQKIQLQLKRPLIQCMEHFDALIQQSLKKQLLLLQVDAYIENICEIEVDLIYCKGATKLVLFCIQIFQYDINNCNQKKNNYKKNFMTTIQKSEAFSFKNQAVNYSKFRPKYPDLLYVNQVNCLQSHKKYLDAATGTGELLFPIASHFEQCRGIDISQKMLQSAKNNLEAYLKDHQNVNIKIQKQSLLDLGNQTQKYDLITIGQALHWLPIEEAISKMKNMLTQDGKLLIMGYGLQYIQNYANKENKEDNILYQNFYNKINTLGVQAFGFNRDQLKNHYSCQNRYPFSKYFDHVKRNQAEVRVRMNREQFECYLRTFAQYNLYLKKFEDDPLVDVMQKISNQIECVFTFFVIVCQK